MKHQPKTEMDELFDTMVFYDRKTPKAASVRNSIGEVAEEIACRALGMKRLKVDGRLEFCADALWQGKPAEIKSVGKNDRALIYKWRKEKELRHVGPDYRYVFLRHTCPISVGSGGDVADFFRDNPPSILITTLGAVVEAIGDMPCRTFKIFTGEAGTSEPFDRKTMHGSQRKGYVDGGWQFSLKKIPFHYTTRTAIQWRGELVNITLQHG